METLKLGASVSAVNLPGFRRVFRKFSDSSLFPANPNVVCANPVVPGVKPVLNVTSELCITDGGNGSRNGSGSNGQGGGFNKHNNGDGDHFGPHTSGLVLFGMQALLQGTDEGKLFDHKQVCETLCFLICQCVSMTSPAHAQSNDCKDDDTHGHAVESDCMNQTHENGLSSRSEESQELPTSMANSDHKQKMNDLPVSNADTLSSSHDVLSNRALESSEGDVDVFDSMALEDEWHLAFKAADMFIESLDGKMAHISSEMLRSNQEPIVTALGYIDAGHGDMTISDQDVGSLLEGCDSNRDLSIDGSSEMELSALQLGDVNAHASGGEQAQLEKPNSIKSNGFKEIDLASTTSSEYLLQGVVRWFEQLGHPKQVVNHESTSTVEQGGRQESRVLSGEGATTTPKVDNETGGKPLGAKQSDIDTLKRLQREAFFELMKLRDKLEKIEQVTQAFQKLERLGAARTHLKGLVKAGAAFVVLEDESSRQRRDSLERAGMQTGLDVKFTFETPFRESDVLITQILAGQSGSVGGGGALGGPLRLGKLHYVAHLNDDISLSIVPLGAQGQDVTEIVNVLQDQGLTSFSSQGPTLFNQCKGSALGATVSGSKLAFSFAQYLSGWGNHVSATDSLAEEDPLCYSTLGQLLFQPTEGFILSFCGLNQYWPTPPLPSSMDLHWSEMGPLIFPRIKAKKANFSTSHSSASSGLDIDRLHTHWEAPDLESGGPATFQTTKGTGLLSLAVSSSLELGEGMSLSGWAQIERGELLQDTDKGNFQWAMCLGKNSGTGIDWGASIGGSRHDIWRTLSSSYDDYSGHDTADLHGTQLQVEAFLKLSCGKGFTLQPGLLYVLNKSSHTPAIVVRSSWSL